MEALVIALVKSVALVLVLLGASAYLSLLERKLVGRIQVRYGPNRAGPMGLLQPLADGVKLIFKEDVVPGQADRLLHDLAPAISLLVGLIAFAVIPIGGPISIAGRTIPLYIADVNVGILYILAVGSLGVYGIVLAGWSSNNKYSLLGGLRSAAQMISYELSLGLSIVGVLLLAGSASLVDIVSAQARVPYIVLQPLGFLIYMIAAIAETNRAPFDLPEADTELVAGYHTEYSGLKFASFFLAEYMNIITVSAIATTLFLGGWQWPPILPGPHWFLIKVFLLVFIFVWLRATFPRLRYDRLMRLGWQLLLPLALLNAMATAVGVVLFA